MKSQTDQYSLRLQYTAEASEFYCRKMMGLIERDKHELRGYIPDGKDGIRSELPARRRSRLMRYGIAKLSTSRQLRIGATNE